MKILLTSTFKRAAKKLPRKQLLLLEEAISILQTDPLLGELKLGDLTGVRVFKFHMYHQLILLAYLLDEGSETITLLSFTPHENFL